MVDRLPQQGLRLTINEIRSNNPDWTETMVLDYFGRTGDAETLADIVGEHIADTDNPHEVLHDQLTDVTPDQHHNQVHLLYGPDHSDVLVDGPLAENEGLFWDAGEGKFIRETRMNFVRPYVVGDTYDKDDAVLDPPWQMVANKTTEERAGPQPIGDPAYTLPDAPGWTTYADTSVIYSGHLYTFTEHGYFRSLRVWVPELTDTTNYRVVIVRNPLSSNPTYTFIDNPILNLDNWTVLSADTILVLAGEQLLVYLDSYNAGGEQTWAYNWVMANSSNTITPVAGEWNTNVQRSLLRINWLDAEVPPVSHQLELRVAPETVFEISEVGDPSYYIHYRVQGAYNEVVDHTQYAVSISAENNGGPRAGNPTQIRAVQPVPDPTKYVAIDSYWGPGTLPVWAGIESYLQYNGVAQPISGDEAFGIDISFQQLDMPEDWDIFGYLDTGGGASNQLDTISIMTAASYVQQSPAGLGAAMQVSFGAAQDTPEFSLSAAGAFTCRETDTYDMSLRLVVGRNGAGSEVQMYMRMLIDGVQAGDSAHVIVDNQRIEMPLMFDGPVLLIAGQVMTFEIIRDTDGANDGQLEPGIPDVAGWAAAPSARLSISRKVIG